jgi:hypothetical protein
MNKPLLIIFLIASIITLAAIINFIPMVSLKMPGMKEYSLHGITVYAMEKDAPEAERVAERIARNSAEVAAALGAGDAAVEVILYPDQKALHRKTIGLAGVFLPDWFIGDNTREYVLITSPAAPGPSHSRESVEQAAVHEYVHVLTDRRNKKLGYWFKEGIALYMAEQEPTRESLRAVSHITWEEYSRPSALQFARVGGYSLAYTLIEYIVERHGWDTVIRLVEPEANLESVLGYGERKLFEEWKTWLTSSL